MRTLSWAIRLVGQNGGCQLPWEHAGKVRLCNAPGDGVPGFVAHVEDEVLRVSVDRPGEDLLPVLKVRPRFIRGRAGERREASAAVKSEHKFLLIRP